VKYSLYSSAFIVESFVWIRPVEIYLFKISGFYRFLLAHACQTLKLANKDYPVGWCMCKSRCRCNLTIRIIYFRCFPSDRI
jgi:hypothetical protein